jgi:hypothetical protein
VAQVLQNGVWSNSVPFATSNPYISTVTPGSGAAGAQVTIAGSGFGASQGTGNVWLGSTYGNVGSWSNTQVVATVASGSATGSVRIQQGGVWSNTVHFVVPTVGSGNAETIVPNVLSLLVGQTRTIQALNSSGAVVSGLAWTSSDTTVVSLSTDDPPILTAVAPGHVSITAGDASADVTVYSGSALPTGTVIWSAPGDGTGVTSIMPAVPSSTGVADVFALQTDGNVQAITTDGSVVWTANVGSGKTLLPDFQGGLVVASATSIQRLDGMTGQPDSQYTYAGAPQSNVAIHTNGTIFTVDGSSLVGINPATGTPIFTIPLDQSTSDQSNACYSEPDTLSSSPPQARQLIIAGDGNAYLLYQYTENAMTEQSNNGICNQESYDQLHLRLLQVDPSGNAQKIVIQDWGGASSISTDVIGSSYYDIWTQNGITPTTLNVQMVTNADSGVLLALQYGLDSYCSFKETGPRYFYESGCVSATSQRSLMTVSGGSVASNTLLTTGNPQYGVVPMLQGQDGNYFGVGLSTPTSMDHFDQNGNVVWSVPNFTPVIATADGGVIAQSSTGQYVTFDQNGVADGMLAELPTYSWIGNWYSLSGVSLSMISLQPADVDVGSFWPVAEGNPSANGTAVAQCPCVLQAPLLTSSNSTSPRIRFVNYSSTHTHSTISAFKPGSYPMLAPPASGGNQKEYVILVGDQGRNNGPGRNWNVGNLFNLSAQTQSDSLNAMGNNVLTDRVTYVQADSMSLTNSLTTHGLIDGGVIFFGHGGNIGIYGAKWPALFVGQDPNFNENLSAFNVTSLSNVQLGPNTTITLNACHAGSGSGGMTSIAQLLANQLQRKVFAYNVGMFFSTDPTARTPSSAPLPNNTPIYMVPWNGAPLLEFDPK